MDKTRVADLIRELLREIGEDPAREGLCRTPERVAEAWAFLSQGYRQNRAAVVGGGIFSAEVNNMILARDIEVYSLCEHHLLPFFGRCHIGYIAQRKVIGVSKVARIVEFYARRLQMQERMTAQIAEEIMRTVDAEGVGVVMECRHLCMMMRGVEKQNSKTITSALRGNFREDRSTREEFLRLVHGR